MKNEELYKTPEERQKAFDCFCERHDNCNGCPACEKGYNCRFTWLTLEAEKEGPIPCPFCGGNDICASQAVSGLVKCKSCGAEMTADTEAEAVVKWNRRAK